jgi:hypothetical protein
MSKRISVHTDIEKFLAEEDRHNESLTGSKVLRVKPEEVGDAWLVRFLPVGLGKKQRWFIRQAKHWFKKSPIACPRHMADDFGGDPDAACPVCDLSKELRDDTEDEISKIGFEIRPNLTYTVYCIVIQIQKRRQEAKELTGEELLIPWEFQMYPQTFEELRDYFRRGVSSNRPLSVLDLERGNDFWATKTKKGIRLDKDDPGPAFGKNVTEDEIETIFSSIKEPRIKIPSLKEMNTFARKVEDFVDGDGSRDSHEGRSARGSRLRDDPETDKEAHGDDDEPAEPPRRQGRHSRQEPAAEPEGRRATRRDEAEQTEVRGRRSASEPEEARSEGRRAGREEAAEPEGRRATRRDEAAAEPEGRRAGREEAAEPEGRRATRRAAQEPEPDEDQVPGAEVPARGSRRAAASEPEEKEPEDEGVAEEKRDPVPPRRPVTGDDEAEGARSEERRGRRGTPEPEPDQGDPADDQTDSPRSQVAGSVGGRGSGGRNSSLRQRISRVSSRD